MALLEFPPTADPTDYKASVRAATTAALPASTYSASTRRLTADANGALGAQDGVTLVATNRLLVKDEVTGANRGIYEVVQIGTADPGGTPWILQRAADFDQSSEITSGLQFVVEEGTVAGDRIWQLTTSNPITLDTTSLSFGGFPPSDADLDAIAALSGTGIAARTAANTWALRTIAGTTNQVVVTNGDGVAGAPTLALPQDMHTTATPAFSGARFAGALSEAAWTTAGIGIRVSAATYTDTSSSGTVAVNAANALARPTLAASSATTYTDSSTLYIAGAPIAGTNVTLTSAWALHVAGGATFLNGELRTASRLAVGGPTIGARFRITAAEASSEATTVSTARVVRAEALTFTATADSGTVAAAVSTGLYRTTFAASSTTTYTDAAQLYIANAPAAGSNVTLTSAWALWVDAGESRFDGLLDLTNIAAGSPNLRITATSDVPAVTWGAAAGNEASAAPAGYIEIVVGGSARYVPFWA